MPPRPRALVSGSSPCRTADAQLTMTIAAWVSPGHDWVITHTMDLDVSMKGLCVCEINVLL